MSAALITHGSPVNRKARVVLFLGMSVAVFIASFGSVSEGFFLFAWLGWFVALVSFLELARSRVPARRARAGGGSDTDSQADWYRPGSTRRSDDGSGTVYAGAAVAGAAIAASEACRVDDNSRFSDSGSNDSSCSSSDSSSSSDSGSSSSSSD